MSSDQTQNGKSGPIKESEERKFLHDLSNPLAIASGLVDILLSDNEKNPSLTDEQKRRLEKAFHALERIKELLRARRGDLTAQSDPKDPNAGSASRNRI